ncbi:MAG TPA: hypothetical protein VGE27_16270 [Gemmatimonas sp.]|uniref:hypothetical protein n=1 Tax=Gemmatimonas sp. TaxID=1962908 RepID=UPI002EDBA8BF
MSASYDPNKQGWGAAVVTCVFTGALLFGAWTIHKNTYRHPRDPMAQQVYHERDAAKHGAAASHDAPAGEHAAPAAEHGAEQPAAAKH